MLFSCQTSEVHWINVGQSRESETTPEVITQEYNDSTVIENENNENAEITNDFDETSIIAPVAATLELKNEENIPISSSATPDPTKLGENEPSSEELTVLPEVDKEENIEESAESEIMDESPPPSPEQENPRRGEIDLKTEDAVNAQNISEGTSTLMLTLLCIFVVIIVIYTISVAIRSAFKQSLSKRFSIPLSILLTAFPMFITYLIVGWSAYLYLYFILLGTFFVFNSRSGQ